MQQIFAQQSDPKDITYCFLLKRLEGEVNSVAIFLSLNFPSEFIKDKDKTEQC